MYDTYFENSNSEGGTVYETELGNKIYYSELQKDSTLNILSRNKMMDEWGKGNMLPGSINESMNASYPYVLADGITIYYAADGPASMVDTIFRNTLHTTTRHLSDPGKCRHAFQFAL